MPAGTDWTPENHGGSYLLRGKERQPVEPAKETMGKQEKQPKIPDDAIERIVNAARDHLRRLTRSL